MRWTLCAEDQCFPNSIKGFFASAGKALLVVRKGGYTQNPLSGPVDILNRGGWVHIYPEGTITRTGKLNQIRRGISVILHAIRKPTIVLPIYIHGLGAVKPVGTYIPTTGHRVDVLVGDPVDFSDILNAPETDHDARIAAITTRIRDNLLSMQTELLTTKYMSEEEVARAKAAVHPEDDAQAAAEEARQALARLFPSGPVRR